MARVSQFETVRICPPIDTVANFAGSKRFRLTPGTAFVTMCGSRTSQMRHSIDRVAVLGAGTMGAQIAAHLANAGIPCYLLDIVPTELNAEEKRKGLTLEDARVRNR